MDNDEDPMVGDAIDDEFEQGTGPRKFLYEELVRATGNFEEEQKLGQGGFGGVYKGFIKDLNSYVAVKRDIKSSSIMLDSNFNAKLGDFGLARLADHGKQSQTTVLAGTMGYMAPECVTTGKAKWVWKLYGEGSVIEAADPKLCGEFDEKQV
ncbi:hypothetical protein ACLB2K_056257 [Fragaria x ananassa]